MGCYDHFTCQHLHMLMVLMHVAVSISLYIGSALIFTNSIHTRLRLRLPVQVLSNSLHTEHDESMLTATRVHISSRN